MSAKYFDEENCSEEDDYFEEVFGKRIRIRERQFDDIREEKFSFPPPSINFLGQKCCPKEELAKKCKR